jgi:hypothetical protein
MRKSKKTQRSKRAGPAAVKITIPSTRPTSLGMPPKPDKRREFQILYDSIASTHSREQFSTWFKEVKLIESGAETKSDEFLNYVADIEKDQQRYQQIIEQLPNVADFSEKELEKRTGKADRLLRLAGEFLLIRTYLGRNIDRLRFLLENRRQ